MDGIPYLDERNTCKVSECLQRTLVERPESPDFVEPFMYSSILHISQQNGYKKAEPDAWLNEASIL